MTAPQMTLSEIRLATRQRADRVIAGGDYTDSFITDQELNSYINQSLFELYDLLVARYESYYYICNYGFITDGVSDQFALPGDFYKLLGVDLQISANASGSNGYLSLRKFEMVDRNKFAYPNVQVVYGVLTNLRYKLAGNTLWLVPRAGAGQTLRVWYAPKLAPLVDSATVTLASNLADGDTITIKVGMQAAVVFTAKTSPSADNEFGVESTSDLTTAAFLSKLAFFPALGLTGNRVASTITFTSTLADPVTITTSVPSKITITPDRWSYIADGIGGWLEYVIVDAALKMLQKEESDVSVFMAQKQGLIKRIEEMSHNRDAGAPSTVRDIQGSNPAFPGPGFGGGGGYSSM